eukprot:1152598-Pelagomonas_calceolata.AAC.5
MGRTRQARNGALLATLSRLRSVACKQSSQAAPAVSRNRRQHASQQDPCCKAFKICETLYGTSDSNGASVLYISERPNPSKGIPNPETQRASQLPTPAHQSQAYANHSQEPSTPTQHANSRHMPTPCTQHLAKT